MHRTRSGLVGTASILTALTLLTAGCSRVTAPAVNPSVRLAVMPASITAIVGASVKTTVTVAPEDGFTGTVALSMLTSSGKLAQGVTLSPSSVTLSAGMSSTFPLTLTLAGGLRAGTEALELSATHKGSTQTVPLKLVLDYSGTFGTPTVYAISTTAFHSLPYVVAKDISGDGIPDVVLSTSGCPSQGCTSYLTAKAWVFVNHGDGTFPGGKDVPAYPTGSGSRPVSIAVADVTGNQFPDVITEGTIYSYSSTGVSSGAVGVLPNEGNSGFGTAATYSTGDNYGAQLAGAAVEDVNGDGLPDIVAGDHSHPRYVSVLLNTGSGTFASPKSYPTGAVADSLAVVDVDGDGHPDIVTASDGTGGGRGLVSVLLNSGDGTFAAPTTYPVANSSTQPQLYVRAADVNGDGHPDLVVMGTAGGHGVLWVMLNNGDGTFGSPTRYAAGGPTFRGGLAVADVNGDGLPDIVTAHNGSGSGWVTVLLNQGGGAFGTFVRYPTLEPNTAAVAVADVNGDGKPDIITGNAGPNSAGSSISVLLGQ